MIDELSKRDAEALGVGDMTGPQLRWRVFQVEGMMCELALALEEMLEVFAPDDRWLNRRAIESAERAREVATSVRERYAHLPRKADDMHTIIATKAYELGRSDERTGKPAPSMMAVAKAVLWKGNQ